MIFGVGRMVNFSFYIFMFYCIFMTKYFPPFDTQRWKDLVALKLSHFLFLCKCMAQKFENTILKHQIEKILKQKFL